MSSMIGRLRSLWSAPPAAPAPPRRVWRDWVLVSVIPVIALFEGLVRQHEVPNVVVAVALTIALVPTLLWRRTHPLLMMLIAFVTGEIFRIVTGSDIQLVTIAYLLLLLYSLFRWGSGRSIVLGGALILVITTLSALLGPPVLLDIIGSFAVVLLTVTLGLLFRLRAASRLRELDRAKSREREELARDLHDTVAHHVSAIAIQAQAGLASSDADAAANALRVIEGEASRTLSELRSMVRVLRRDDAAELAPARQLDDLKELASDGPPLVAVELDGVAAAVSEPVAAASYRIAQEAVTNARRHARNATRIEVRLTVDRDRVRLTVHDDGSTAGPRPPGYGITGMVERATLLGGTCAAGPGAGGGWTVSAELPNRGARA